MSGARPNLELGKVISLPGAETVFREGTLDGRPVLIRTATSYMHRRGTSVEDRIEELRSILDECNPCPYLLSTCGFVGHNPRRLTSVHPRYSGDLTDVLGKRPLTRSEALVACDSLVRAVAFLHLREIRHWDVKLDNAMIGITEVDGKERVTAVVLGDFGYSFPKGSKLEPDQCFGTPGYLLQHEPGNGMSRDIGGLGLSLWAVVNGRFHQYTTIQKRKHDRNKRLFCPMYELPRHARFLPYGSLQEFVVRFLQLQAKGRANTGVEALTFWEERRATRNRIGKLYPCLVTNQDWRNKFAWTGSKRSRLESELKPGEWCVYWKPQDQSHKIVRKAEDGSLKIYPVTIEADGTLLYEGSSYASRKDLLAAQSPVERTDEAGPSTAPNSTGITASTSQPQLPPAPPASDKRSKSDSVLRSTP